MADNLTTTTTVSTVPSGTVIATDDAGAGGHVQVVKLAISTDGSATALTADNTNGLLVNTELPAAAALADATANPTTPSAGAFLQGYNGTTWDRLRSTTANGLAADITRIAAGDNNIGNVDIVTMPNVTLAAGTNTNEVVGDVAHDAAAAGNPVLVGAFASAAAPTDVSADADAVRLWALRNGALASQPTFAGVLGVAGNGASGTGVQRVTVANDSTGILAGVTTVTTVTNVATIGTSITPGTSAAHLGKAEDAVAASGDTGVAVLAVRRDTPSSDVSAAGDYATLQVNATGSLWVADRADIADNAAFTDGTTPVNAAGYIFDETAGTALTENDIGASRMDSKRAQVMVIEDVTTRGTTVRAGVNTSLGLQVTPVPHTAGGTTAYHLIAAATTNATNVKASAGQVFGWHITNEASTWVYVKLHNTAGTPTAGASVVWVIGVPPAGGSNVSFDHGIAFATGIAITTVTGIADSNTTAVAASILNINLFYK